MVKSPYLRLDALRRKALRVSIFERLPRQAVIGFVGGLLTELIVFTAYVSAPTIPVRYLIGSIFIVGGILLATVVMYPKSERNIRFGKPDKIDQEGVRWYNGRKGLPRFGEIFPSSKEIHLLGRNLGSISMEFRNDNSPLEDAITSNPEVNIYAYLLPANSVHVDEHPEIDPTATPDLKKEMESARTNLESVKARLTNPSRLHIMIYDGKSKRNFVVLDPNDKQRAWIQVEELKPRTPTGNRPNRIGTITETPRFFDTYYTEFLETAKGAIEV